MPKYELFTTGEVPDFPSLRSYVGYSKAVSVSDVTTGGLFLHDETDSSSSDDNENTVVDYKGRRWKRDLPDVNSLTFIQAGTGAVSRSLRSKVRDVVNLLDFGADVSGASDCSDAFNNALATGAIVLLPPGTLLVNEKINLPNGAVLRGAGIGLTTIRSGVIGDSLFHTTASSTAFIHMSDMTIDGNGLTGASGNGHAINFIDPAIDSGSHSPQFAVLERLYIRDFRGNDVVPGSASTFEACGVVQADGLHNIYRDVLVQNCGHGFYLYRAQNTKLDNCAVDGVDKAALIVYDCENIIVEKCDFADGADGVPSTNYPVSFGSAMVVSYQNEGFVLSDCKVKNTNGGMLIRSILSHGDVIENSWLRPDSLTDNVHKGIYAERSKGIRIINNRFTPANTGFTTRKYQQIELYNTQTNDPVSATIQGNIFDDVNGMTVEYNIKINGNATARSFGPVTITDNQFGTEQESTAATVDADILIESCTLRNSKIAYNQHYAPTNVTRTAGVSQAVSATLSKVTVGPSEFIANGGTLTANYSGLTESVLTGSKTQDWADLATATQQSTTVTVTGAVPGDYVESVSMSVALSGTRLWGEVTAADTVTVYHRNDTGGNVNVASGTLRVRVQKAG